MAEELHFENPAAAAQDPSTDAESLRQLAYRYPELRPLVAAHPHAYRGLLEWLHQFNDPQVNATLEARDDYDGYIDANGCLVMRGDVSGAVAGSAIRTSESGMYVLGQGGVDSYSQIERTTPYSAVAGKNLPVPQVDKREQVVAQVQRQSIMGGKASQDPEATAVYPSPVTSSTYPTTASSATASSSTESTAQLPRAYTPTPAARQPAQVAQPAAATASRGRRSFPMMTIVLVSRGRDGTERASPVPDDDDRARQPGCRRGDPPGHRHLRVHSRIRGTHGRFVSDVVGVPLGESEAIGECYHDRGREVPGTCGSRESR